MKNISFMLTTKQFIDQTKTVTRRNGWKNLKPGTHLMGVEKCQGLKKGEKINKLKEIVVKTVKFERLDRMITKRSYGLKEVVKEGFPNMTPEEFVEMYCKHNKCTPETIVTRISFTYLTKLGIDLCHKCGDIAFKTDGYSRPWCETCYNKELKKAMTITKNHFDKIGRNEACHCGSGKKYKKCCLTKINYNEKNNPSGS